MVFVLSQQWLSVIDSRLLEGILPHTTYVLLGAMSTCGMRSLRLTSPDSCTRHSSWSLTLLNRDTASGLPRFSNQRSTGSHVIVRFSRTTVAPWKWRKYTQVSSAHQAPERSLAPFQRLYGTKRDQHSPNQHKRPTGRFPDEGFERRNFSVT